MLLTMVAAWLQALQQKLDTFIYDALRGLKVVTCVLLCGKICKWTSGEVGCQGWKELPLCTQGDSASILLQPPSWSNPSERSEESALPVFCHLGCLSTNLAQGWNGSGGRSAVKGISNKREKKKTICRMLSALVSWGRRGREKRPAELLVWFTRTSKYQLLQLLHDSD